MQWILLLLPLAVTYYTLTFGLWALKNGNRRGAGGIFILAFFNLALSVYAIFIRTGF